MRRDGDTSFDRFEEAVDVVVVVIFRRRKRRNRRGCRRGNPQLDRGGHRCFTFILRWRLRFGTRGHKHSCPDAVPVVQEFSIGQLEEGLDEWIRSTDGRDGDGSQLLVTNDAIGIQLANERNLSSTTISKLSIPRDYQLTKTPFVAFHHWSEVPLVSPRRRASSITR